MKQILAIIIAATIASLAWPQVTIVDVDPATRASPANTMRDVDANLDALATAVNAALTSADIDTQPEANAIRTDLSGTFAADSTGDQANATELTAERCYITAAGANYAVKLPTAAANAFRWVENTSAYDVRVYPGTSDDLGAGANAYVLLPAGKTGAFLASDATNWTSMVAPKDVHLVFVSSAYTLGTNDPNELKGAIVYVTATATLTLPAIDTADFGWASVIPVGTAVATIDPNAADGIRLDGAGTALADGTAIVSSSTAGDMAMILPYDGAAWMVMATGFASE